MKNFKNFKLLSFFVIASMFIIALSSCTKNDDDTSMTNLSIISVSKALNGSPNNSSPENNDSLTSVGYPSNMYIIRGTGLSKVRHVYFNDLESSFNRTLVTDNVMFVTINKNTPYTDVSNLLKLVSDSESATYSFVVGPPAPIFSSFNPINAVAGDIMTIKGEFLLDPIVKFGDIDAEVLTGGTLNEIQIKVPAGADKKLLTVRTISGTTTSTYAVGTAIFDDIFYSPWTIESWNNHSYETVPNAQQGNVVIKKTMAAYDNMQGNWGWDDKIADYKGIRISIKAQKPGQLKFIFNGDWSERNMLDVTTEWTTYVITWDKLGNPAAVQNISFQNFTKVGNDGAENTFYIDNVGYALK